MARPTVAWFENGDELRAAVGDLVSAVTDAVRPLKSEPDNLPRYFAAVALARSARLVRAMLVLRESELEDVCDVPLRLVAEHITLGMYLLYGGTDALEHMRGAHIYERRLMDVGDEETQLHQSAWTGPLDRLKWQDLMHNVVPPLIEKATGDRTAASSFRRLYDQIYRGQSLLVAHAGAGSLGRHVVVEEAGRRRINPEGALIEDGTGPIVMAATLLGILAVHVLEVFGAPNDDVIRLTLQIKDPGELREVDGP